MHDLNALKNTLHIYFTELKKNKITKQETLERRANLMWGNKLGYLMT